MASLKQLGQAFVNLKSKLSVSDIVAILNLCINFAKLIVP